MSELIKGAFVALCVTGGVGLVLIQAAGIDPAKGEAQVECFELQGQPMCIAYDEHGDFLWMRSPRKGVTVIAH